MAEMAEQEARDECKSQATHSHISLPPSLPPSLPQALRKNLDDIATLKHTTSSAIMAEMAEQEARGEQVNGASKRDLAFWRALIRGKDLGWNVAVAAHNFLLRPLSLFWLKKKEWAATPLPLNLAEMIALLFQVGREGGRREGGG